ncbi:MAG: PIG-L family deacetylase [Planctomycetota bacterium]
MARVIVFGPHPDDQELGMGGTIARLASEGHAVLLVDLTNGEPTPLGNPEIRAGEAEAARAALCPPGAGRGLPVRRLLLGLPNRVVEHTADARHRIAAVIRAWQADVLFTPFFEDAHPDHRAVTRLVEDARFDAKLSRLALPPVPEPSDGMGPLVDPSIEPGVTFDEIAPPRYPRWLFYYYATHLRWVANPSFIMDVTGFEDVKRTSIEAYETQFVRPEKNRAVARQLGDSLAYFGGLIGVGSGEPFFTKEPLGITGLAGVLR